MHRKKNFNNAYTIFKVECSNNVHIIGGEIYRGQMILLRSHNKTSQGPHDKRNLTIIKMLHEHPRVTK